MKQHSKSNHNEVEILCQNPNGYVVRCRHCHFFHIVFGNIGLDQSKQDLIDLMHLIHRYCAEYKPAENNCQRYIYVDTPHQGFRLLFSPKELILFHEMLQKTYLIIQAEDIINN